MDNTGIRSRRKKYRRRVRNIRVGLTLFVICLIAVAIPVIREMLRKPAQITIQVADIEVTQGTALPSYTADVKIQDKDKNKLTKTYTAEDFAKDLQKGKDITISSKADSNIEGTYVITAKLSEKIKNDPRVLRPARLRRAARLGAACGDERRGLRRERARRLGDEPLERHAARGDVTGAFLQSQRAGPRRGRPVLPIGRRFSPP